MDRKHSVAGKTVMELRRQKLAGSQCRPPRMDGGNWTCMQVHCQEFAPGIREVPRCGPGT